jgi:hypothetical protein
VQIDKAKRLPKPQKPRPRKSKRFENNSLVVRRASRLGRAKIGERK